MTLLRGSCLCGATRYEVADEFHAAFYCHCSRCRRATGSAFKPMAAISFASVTLLTDAEGIMIYGEPPGSHDIHCRQCGSFLYSFIAENGNAHVTMGTLLDRPSIKPTFHMFVADKAPWYEIGDDLPQFEGFPS